jgi:hypothetical protein
MSFGRYLADLAEAKSLAVSFKQRLAESARVITVNDATYYWRSTGPARVGMTVPPFKGKWRSKARAELEAVFERVRQEKNPSAPPRVGSVMLCPSPEGFCSPNYLDPGDKLYEVRASGRVWLADSELWTEAVMKSLGWREDSVDVEEASRWARAYWTRAPDEWNTPEVLLDGKAVIVREV